MELGEKLRRARLEAGLSQRQLCGEEITRNMLSLIENGSAKPSMKTLQYLASRLGKNVSFFLEETVVLSPNQAVMASARELYDAGQFAEADRALDAYRSPDETYDREKEILWVLIRLGLAEEAIRQQRHLYALELLKQTPVATAYLQQELNRKKLLLLGMLPGQQVSDQLPELDEELLLRAEEALAQQQYPRCSRLLDAMEHTASPRWHLCRGNLHLQQKQWKKAASHLRQAEEAFPHQVYPKLETCYRELGNFQKAYEYACKQRK